MVNRIKAFFVDQKALPGGEGGHHTVDEFHLAAAALLVEAASIDGAFDDAERARILDFAGRRLGLSELEAETLLQAAETAAGKSTQLFGPAGTAVPDAVAPTERRVLSMPWRLAIAALTVYVILRLVWLIRTQGW